MHQCNAGAGAGAFTSTGQMDKESRQGGIRLQALSWNTRQGLQKEAWGGQSKSLWILQCNIFFGVGFSNQMKFVIVLQTAVAKI